MTVLEKVSEKAASIPIQKMAVARADGNRSGQETLRASRNHIVNHQTAVSTARPVTASRTRPPEARNQGLARPHRYAQPTRTVSQESRRGCLSFLGFRDRRRARRAVESPW